MKKILLLVLTLFTFDARAELIAYTPDLAISEALSEPLHLVGKGMLYGFYSIPSCLYANSKVLVVHGYCTNPESPAAEIEIYSPAHGQMLQIHAESQRNDKPISEVDPKSYPPEFWYLVDNQIEHNFPLTTDFVGFAHYYQKIHQNYPPHCLVSEQFERCDDQFAAIRESWLASAKEFRETPSKDWLQILRTLKASVPKAD